MSKVRKLEYCSVHSKYYYRTKNGIEEIDHMDVTSEEMDDADYYRECICEELEEYKNL